MTTSLMTTLLAIETSCDETSVAIVRRTQLRSSGSDTARAIGELEVMANVVSSQVATHARFGGVVPEVASRAHLEMLEPVVEEALTTAGVSGADIDAVAATCGPGLIGALLIGVSSAKALALAWDVPYVGVNHMEGTSSPRSSNSPIYPYRWWCCSFRVDTRCSFR